MKKEQTETRQKINNFLEKILLEIEWKYGDNRAPFKWPPVHLNFLNIFYICKILYEDSKPEFIISTNPEKLFKKVQESVKKRVNI
jgi:hypothetical protein